jgi:hypothetical protein
MEYICTESQLPGLAAALGLVDPIFADVEAHYVIWSERWIALYPIIDADGNEVDSERRIDAAAIVDTCRRCNVDAETDGTHAARVYLF